jgi:hypothetical protein
MMRRLTAAAALIFLYLSAPLTQSNNEITVAQAASPRGFQVPACEANPDDAFRQQISGMVDGDELVLTVSARFGGAVESLTWRGKEFINIFDHGRQISYAWQMDGYGECFNPTEPGSASDLFSLSSTSELLEVCQLSSNALTTKVLPAYWLAPGETGFCDRGTTAYNDTLVSNQTLFKTIEIGYAGLENVIAFTAEITLPDDYSFLQMEIPTGYLTYEFTNYWRYDPATGELIKPESEPLIAPWSFVNVSQLPPILATEDGQFAMGAFSPENITAYEILRYDVPNPDDSTNKWNIVLHEQSAPAGTYIYQSFVVVGTLEQVAAGLGQLFEQSGFDPAPPEGFVDLASCEVIDGWAWDPKTPDQPIEVEIRRLNEDGTETALARVTADRYREDLASALGDNGRHGFSLPTGEALQDGSRQFIRAYALNTNPALDARPLIPPVIELECPQYEPAAPPEPTEAPPPTAVDVPPATEAVGAGDPEGAGPALPCLGNALPLAAGLVFFAARRRRKL